MSDESFESFEDDENAEQEPELLEEEEEIEQSQRKRGEISLAMTQKLFGNMNEAGRSGNQAIYSESALVTPRNRFEEILKEESVRIINDDEAGVMDLEMGSYEKCVVLEGDLNHEQLVRNLEKRIDKNRGELFEEFRRACSTDLEALSLYLSPSKSKFGLQDTIFRAFLQIRKSQVKTFELLIQKLDFLAKREDQSDQLLAQKCVSHMRYLRLFEPQAIFNTLFEFKWRYWSSTVRNELVYALPEIFTEISLQQAAAIRLNQEILETNEVPDLPSYQLQIIETLRLLRMDSATAREIRMTLCNLCMDLDVFCLPSLTAFVLGSLLAGGSSGKIEEEESQFHEVLRQLSRLLKIDTIKKRSIKSDVLIVETYSHFLKFLQLDKRFWKHVTTWISSKKGPTIQTKDELESTENHEEDSEGRRPEEPFVWLSSFDTFLILSLISNSEVCPSTFLTSANSKFLNVPPAFVTKLLKIIDLAISLKKFSITHLPALIHVARQCFWSPDSNVRHMGVSIWKQLFVGMEKKYRINVFTELMKHFSQSETECEAVLDVFFKVIKSTHSSAIEEFSGQIQKCIEYIHNLSISNTKRLFLVMLMLPTSGDKKDKTTVEIDEIIDKFLISASEREKFLGILALLMKIQVEMSKKHSENQERRIQEFVERCKESVKSSSTLRAAFYDHMRIVLQQHKRTEEIRFIASWSEDLLVLFRNDFFEAPMEEAEDMESNKNNWILNAPSDRLLEVAPLFELIKEMQVMKMRWREQDEDTITSSYDTSAIKDLNFAYEASLVKLDTEDSTSKLNHLFFTAQWCRTVLNAFLAQNTLDFMTSDAVAKLATQKFYSMMDAEKQLAQCLVKQTSWNVPNLKFRREKSDVVVTSVEKSRGRAKKRKSDETNVEEPGSADNTMNKSLDNLETEVVAKDNSSITSQLKTHFIQLKLRPVVHLLKLAEKKRSCMKYLCDELHCILDNLIRQKKKTLPMMAARAVVTKPVDKFYHGDSTTIWFCVKKATERIWGTAMSAFDFFSKLPDASQEVPLKVQKDMEELGEKTLQLIHCILSGEPYGGEEKLSAVEKSERKSVLIRIIEKTLLEAEHLSNEPEQARIEIGNYLAKNAEFSPTPAISVAILDVFEDLKLDEDEQADTRKTMAKFALAYLKKDWSKVDEVWKKGTRYTSAVRDILSHYIRLRKEKDQLLAIQWILTNKVVQLVPEDEKRKSCVLSQQSDDDLLEREDRNAVFYCISKATFGVIFKTLFSCLNSRILKNDMLATTSKNGAVEDEDTLENWEIASSCFLILCLLLRVNKIRTTAVLTTAIREGKQFLITVSKKSSFIYLMDNITKGTNFDAVCKRVERILPAVQQGNRVLQSIGNYAKTNKCVHLLKKFPELRAESENCLRVIHSAMVKNECLNAFTVGLVKSRSIDGEIITDQRDSIESDEE